MGYHLEGINVWIKKNGLLDLTGSCWRGRNLENNILHCIHMESVSYVDVITVAYHRNRSYDEWDCVQLLGLPGVKIFSQRQHHGCGHCMSGAEMLGHTAQMHARRHRARGIKLLEAWRYWHLNRLLSR